MQLIRVTFISIAVMIAVTAAVTFYDKGYTLLDIKYGQLTTDAKKQVDCLAENIYYEAGYEPRDGQVAVAMVTMNRVQDPRFPKDICSVVKQKVNSTCQFSWFCEPRKYINETVYRNNLEVALYVYANYEKLPDNTNGAKFYHADYVNPKWKLEKTTKIGRHIFYRD
jgi:spore germination cell wall hydrolase CwlJ-like protein